MGRQTRLKSVLCPSCLCVAQFTSRPLQRESLTPCTQRREAPKTITPRLRNRPVQALVLVPPVHPAPWSSRGLRNDPLPNTKRTHRGSFAAASCSHPHVPIGLFTLVFSPAQHLQMLYSYSSNSRARIVRGERDQLPLRGRLPQPPLPNGAASGILAINDQTVHHKWYL